MLSSPRFLTPPHKGFDADGFFVFSVLVVNRFTAAKVVLALSQVVCPLHASLFMLYLFHDMEGLTTYEVIFFASSTAV